MYIWKLFGSVIFAVFAEIKIRQIQQTVNITLKIF